MNAVTRILDLLTGRDPADIVAEQFYRAMCAPPPHVALVERLQGASVPKRTRLLERADDATRAAALAWLSAPESTRERDRRLAWIRADAATRLPPIRAYYAQHIADFICDWMYVTDSRRVASGKSAVVPFTLWPVQRKLVRFILDRISNQESGTVVKARDVGATAVCMATLGALCIFRDDFSAGVLSATEAKLDRYQDTVFMKLRGLLRDLPPEFAAGYDEARTSQYLSVTFPKTRSSITGATGSNAFRGLRLTAAVVDEAAFLQDSQAISNALTAVSAARIDVSTPHGVGGAFYDRAHNDAIPRLDISWREDPRRDQAWYDKIVATEDPVTVAQEYNCDFSASREGTVIPASWIQSSVGLHTRLGIEPLGARYAALDLGDTSDRCALAIRHGPYLEWIESWSGAGSDMARSAERAFAICEKHKINELMYDADGLGGPFNGFARLLNDKRPPHERIKVFPYRGSGKPHQPSSRAPRTKLPWEQYVLNRKAQTWIHARWLFEQANLAAHGMEFDKNAFISINPKIPELSKLIAQLSQPTQSETALGLILIDKLGDGEKSPDLGDAATMVFAPRFRWNINPNTLDII
jgi:phage terminase large subunit